MSATPKPVFNPIDLEGYIAEIGALNMAIAELSAEAAGRPARRLAAVDVVSTMVLERLDAAEALIEGITLSLDGISDLIAVIANMRYLARAIIDLADDTGNIGEARLAGIKMFSDSLQNHVSMASNDMLRIDNAAGRQAQRNTSDENILGPAIDQRKKPVADDDGFVAATTSERDSLVDVAADIVAEAHDTLCLAYMVESEVTGLCQRYERGRLIVTFTDSDRKVLQWIASELVARAERADAAANRLDRLSVSRVQH